MLNKLIIPMILLILVLPSVGGTNDQKGRLKSFLRLYCRTYESKDIDKLATFFAHDALENNQPFHELLPKYRKNMEMIESVNYRIELVAYSIEAEAGNVRIQGKYFIRYLLHGGTWKENNGNLSMELVKGGNKYLINRLNYGDNIALPEGGKKKDVKQQPDTIQRVISNNGDYYVALGDSITHGDGDDIFADNNSMDGRISGGGYPPILSDMLANSKGHPVFIANKGKGGETSAGGLYRIQRVIADHPEAQYFLILYGTNDSGGLIPLPKDVELMLDMEKNFRHKNKEGRPSGLGLHPGEPGYVGSFKDNMQRIINAILAAGKKPILAKVPYVFGYYPNMNDGPRNSRIQEYNKVIEKLVSKNGITVTPPDFYSYFKKNKDQFSDRLHPNGQGYQSMAKLWFNALTQDLSNSRFLNKKKKRKKDILVQEESNRDVFSGMVKNKTKDNIDSGAKNQEIIFKVQILISKTILPANSPRFKGLNNIWEYKQHGLYKYTVGSQKDLGSAIALQSEIRKRGFSNAFVVVFQNGKRVPMAVALKMYKMQGHD